MGGGLGKRTREKYSASGSTQNTDLEAKEGQEPLVPNGSPGGRREGKLGAMKNVFSLVGRSLMKGTFQLINMSIDTIFCLQFQGAKELILYQKHTCELQS